MYSYNGKEYTINEICEMIGISKPTFYRRLNKGWSIGKIVNTKSWVQHGNNWRSIREIAEIEHISQQLVHSRYIRTKKTKLPIKYLYEGSDTNVHG